MRAGFARKNSYFNRAKSAERKFSTDLSYKKTENPGAKVSYCAKSAYKEGRIGAEKRKGNYSIGAKKAVDIC